MRKKVKIAKSEVPSSRGASDYPTISDALSKNTKISAAFYISILNTRPLACKVRSAPRISTGWDGISFFAMC